MSGCAFANQARRLSSRLLMLLMLKVATLTKPISVSVLLGASQKEQPSSLFQPALFYRTLTASRFVSSLIFTLHR